MSAPSPASILPVGPHTAAWLRAQRDVAAEERQEGQDAWTIQQWLKHHQKRFNTRKNLRDSGAITAINEALKKDAEIVSNDGEIYTHTLRDETEEEIEEREREEEERAVAEVRRQRQRNALLDPEARAALEQQLSPIVTLPLFEGQTPATPFRIATYVDIELARHALVYQHGRLRQSTAQFARPLLERWFAEHPSDPLPPRVRQEIAEQAERAAIKEMDRIRAQIGRIVRGE